MIAPKKFFSVVSEDSTGDVVALQQADEFAVADAQANSMLIGHSGDKTGWVYKRVRPNSPNKSWVVSVFMIGGDTGPQGQVVKDCVTWKEALLKAAPESKDWELSDDYETALQQAWDQDIIFTCTVIDEIAL